MLSAVKAGGAGGTATSLLAVLCVTVYMFSFGAGAGPLQHVILGELLPPEYKVRYIC